MCSIDISGYLRGGSCTINSNTTRNVANRMINGVLFLPTAALDVSYPSTEVQTFMLFGTLAYLWIPQHLDVFDWASSYLL